MKKENSEFQTTGVHFHAHSMLRVAYSGGECGVCVCVCDAPLEVRREHWIPQITDCCHFM